MQIDTADHVLHRPTDENWLVAFVEDGRLWWCGWPEGSANVNDCVLTKKATAEEREKLLRDMADGRGDDARHRYARNKLVLTSGGSNA